MDVVRLGPVYSTQYVPDILIEGYSSMIWTERFFEPGEFKMTTPLINKHKDLLPPDTLISHLGTGEVMMVETQTIEEGDDGSRQMVIEGRSLDLMLEHRFVDGVYQTKRKMIRNYAPPGAIAVLLYNVLDNSSGKDLTRAGDYSWPTADRIPNVSISDSLTSYGTSRRWWLTEGDIKPQIMSIMNQYDVGLRTIRPSSESNGFVISVRSALSERGTVDRDPISGFTSLRFDMYKGIDRSHSQSTNPRVAFNYRDGHIRRPQYLFSHADYKTAAELMSGVIAVSDYYRNTTERGFTGIRRRVMSIDVGTPELPAAPTRPTRPRSNASAGTKANYLRNYDTYLDRREAWLLARTAAINEFREDAADMAKAEFKLRTRKAIFSGDIDPQAPYQYKRDYNLGDTVSLYGEYGEIEKMLVSEHIHSHDAEGDRSYPGLAEIEP